MYRFLCFTVAWMACGWLTGCMTIGQELESQDIKAIKVGSTTEEDLKSNFGPPGKITSGSDASENSKPFFSKKAHFEGEADLRWVHARWVWSSIDMKELEVWLDSGGKVKDYLVTHVDVTMASGPPLDPKQVEKIKTGVMSKEDLQNIFGSPQIEIYSARQVLCHGWVYYTAGFFSEKGSVLQVLYNADGKVDKVKVHHDLEETPLGDGPDE